jgi:polysaccharide deacetylase 2 family uncharacterized protein YibQ
MANQKNKGDRHQVLIVFLLFIVLVLISIMVGTFNKINLLEKSPVTELPNIEPIIEEVELSVGKIAIVIDDFGYRNDEISEGFLRMNTNLTYAIIPGHEYSQTMSKKASKSGFEVIAHMPMGTTVPSFGEEEYIIKASMTSAEIEDRMEKVLSHLPEVVGMNNHQGSKASANKRVMNVMGTILKNHGIYFLDSRTTKETQAESTMLTLGVPTGRRHVFLDNDSNENAIIQQLYILAEKAKSNGFAVGIGHVKKNTLNVLLQEIPKLKAANFKFVFISEVVN